MRAAPPQTQITPPKHKLRVDRSVSPDTAPLSPAPGTTQMPPDNCMQFIALVTVRVIHGGLSKRQAKLRTTNQALYTGWAVKSSRRHRRRTWRSGDAADCKSVYPGSIPGVASNFAKNWRPIAQFTKSTRVPVPCGRKKPGEPQPGLSEKMHHIKDA